MKLLPAKGLLIDTALVDALITNLKGLDGGRGSILCTKLIYIIIP